MLHYLVKVILTSLIIVGISEIGKRSTLWAAVLASLPLTSLLAFIWLYAETGDRIQVANLSHSIFWLVLPSLPLFLILPLLLRSGWNFWLSLLFSCMATALLYGAMVLALDKAGISL